LTVGVYTMNLYSSHPVLYMYVLILVLQHFDNTRFFTDTCRELVSRKNKRVTRVCSRSIGEKFYRGWANPPVERLSGRKPKQLSASVLFAVKVMITSPPSLNAS